MIPRVIVLALLQAALASAQESAPASAPASRPQLARAEMESDLDFLAAAIREKWSYLEDKSRNFGVDLDALVARAKSRLPETGTCAGLHAIVSELVADLKDGHGSVSGAEVSRPSRRWPFTVAGTAEGVVVVRAMPGGPRPGDRILRIDGAPIESAIAESQRTTIASTDAARRFIAVRRLMWTSASKVTVVIARKDAAGAEEEASVTAPTLDGEPRELRLAPDGPVWSVDRPAGGIARLRVTSFAVEDWKGWLAARPEERDRFLADTRSKIDACFREIAGAEALVVDLRGNGGGTDLLGIHLAKHLLPRRFVYFRLSAKYGGEWSKPHGYEHDPLPADQRFDGPAAILVDEGCFSTTDNFLRAVVENRDGVVVVGRPTNGGTGAPAPIAKLPVSGISVTLCTQRVSGPRGTLTEGRGTVPAVLVKWTAADYLEGRDPDLAAALRALGRVESRASSR